MQSLNTLLLIAQIFLYHLAVPVWSNFNFEVGLLRERVTEFMKEPINILDSVSDLLNKNYFFPHGARSPDRDAFLLLGDALIKTYRHEMIYYGLDDGTFVGNYYPDRMATYREPGENGYEVGDKATEIFGDMHKHYVSCVDKEGAEAHCLMSAGQKYIECVDGCSLKKCTYDVSQEVSAKWCATYVEKQIPEGTQNIQLGYIPLSDYCIDEKGLPTQKTGTVSESLDANAKLTSCYFEDGITAVDRHVEGDYAYCGGGSCNTTFTGAFRTIYYDPRYRSWYKNTRALQKPNWSPPYVVSLFVGIFRNASYQLNLKDLDCILASSLQLDQWGSPIVCLCTEMRMEGKFSLGSSLWTTH